MTGFPYSRIEIRNGVTYVVGGSNATPGAAFSGDCNLLSGNGGHGVQIAGTGTMNNTVSSTAPLGNDQAAHQAGVSLYGNAHHNCVEGNVISDNSSGGVALNLGSGTDHNVVTGNYIGTNASGAAPLGNTWGGLYLAEGASNNLIGGATLAEGNIIAHNGKCDFALSHVTATAADAPTNEQVSLAFSVVDSTVGGQAGQVVF